MLDGRDMSFRFAFCTAVILFWFVLEAVTFPSKLLPSKHPPQLAEHHASAAPWSGPLHLFVAWLLVTHRLVVQ